MLGDRLLRRCFLLSLVINALLILGLSRFDLSPGPAPAAVKRVMRIQVYHPPPAPPKRKPPPPKHPGPKLPPPPHPQRIRQAVRRVVRPVPHPTPHPSPVRARVLRPARVQAEPSHTPPVATGSHSTRGTVVLPPSEGDVGKPTDATSNGGGGDPGDTPQNLSGDRTGLTGEYDLGREFEKLVFTRSDPNIDFDWPDATPDPEQMPPDSAYSVRWMGQIQPRYSELYTFTTLSDDGCRLWIDDRPIIDDWHHHKATERSGQIALVAGHKYSIRLEYFENGDPPGLIHLSWSSDSSTLR